MLNIVPNNIAMDVSIMFILIYAISDKLIWGLNPNGIYLVKSGAKLIQGYSIKPAEKVSFLWI